MRSVTQLRKATGDATARLMGKMGLVPKSSATVKGSLSQVDIIRLPVVVADSLQRTNGTFKFMLGYDPLSAFSLEE